MSVIKKKPPQPPSKRSTLWDIEKVHFIPATVEAPKQVAAAAEQAREARAVFEAAEAKRNEAGAAAKDAPAFDEAADLAALERGEEMPERTEPMRRHELAVANRESKAAEAALRDALYAQSGPIRDCYEEWCASQEARVASAAEEVRNAIAEVDAVFARHEQEKALMDALRGFYGEPKSWVYAIRDPQRRAKALESVRANARDSVAQSCRVLVKPELNELLAALEVLVEKADA